MLQLFEDQQELNENSTNSVRLTWVYEKVLSLLDDLDGPSSPDATKSPAFTVLQVSIDPQTGRKRCRYHPSESDSIVLSGLRSGKKYQFAVKAENGNYSLPVTLDFNRVWTTIGFK